MAYRIKTVASLVGVPRNTLLAWERRYGLGSPGRGDNGYRLYSEADVAMLREVKELIDKGHAISEAIGIVRERTRSFEALPSAAAPLAFVPTATEAKEEALAALLRFDRAAADRAMGTLSHLTFKEILHGLCFPMLRQVGHGWERGAYTVVQEHFVTAFVRDHMVSMFLRLGCGPEGGPRAVTACFPDDEHELGLLGLSIEFALGGWRVTHLGAKVPEDQLIDFVAEHPPKALCVSVVVEPEVGAVERYAGRVRKALPAETALFIGGPAVPAGLSVAGVHFAERVEDIALAGGVP